MVGAVISLAGLVATLAVLAAPKRPRPVATETGELAPPPDELIAALRIDAGGYSVTGANAMVVGPRAYTLYSLASDTGAEPPYRLVVSVLDPESWALYEEPTGSRLVGTVQMVGSGAAVERLLSDWRSA